MTASYPYVGKVPNPSRKVGDIFFARNGESCGSNPSMILLCHKDQILFPREVCECWRGVPFWFPRSTGDLIGAGTQMTSYTDEDIDQWEPVGNIIDVMKIPALEPVG